MYSSCWKLFWYNFFFVVGGWIVITKKVGPPSKNVDLILGHIVQHFWHRNGSQTIAPSVFDQTGIDNRPSRIPSSIDRAQNIPIFYDNILYAFCVTITVQIIDYGAEELILFGIFSVLKCSSAVKRRRKVYIRTHPWFIILRPFRRYGVRKPTETINYFAHFSVHPRITSTLCSLMNFPSLFYALRYNIHRSIIFQKQLCRLQL